jgi:DNA-binding transcriptional regulator GbsR (MarR family)
MTEISEHNAQGLDVAARAAAPYARLSPQTWRFILHWGNLGASWGVNRSIAQIHALLLLAEAPMPADAIADSLGLARSNVSNSLKDLVQWGLVRRAPVAGDRRDHFIAEGDIWEMGARIAALRKAREIDPAAEVLRDTLAEAREGLGASPGARRRLEELQELIGLLDGFYEQVSRLPKAKVLPALRLGAKAIELLSPFLGGRESAPAAPPARDDAQA